MAKKVKGLGGSQTTMKFAGSEVLCRQQKLERRFSCFWAKKFCKEASRTARAGGVNTKDTKGTKEIFLTYSAEPDDHASCCSASLITAHVSRATANESSSSSVAQHTSVTSLPAFASPEIGRHR